ncbi:MAG: CDP-alcohol phosphatidyltransferase family protein [Longimicrobiales bacterium]|nr:CDP-alcohol phosphatidyltransferase family protein [Longimicrobiales bacterium]
MPEKGFKALREPVYRLIDPVVRGLIRLKVHPNAVSTVGFVTTLAAGLLYHQDHVRTAGLLVLLGGIVDIFDGRVARESGLESKFGAFYDSTLDRLSEVVVFVGLASLYNTIRGDLEDVAMIYVILMALGGSLTVSYTRARAEGLGLDCKVGLMQRAERVVLLGLGSLLFGLAWDGLVLDFIIITVAVLTNLTAIQRIVWVYQHGRGVPLE